MTFEERFPDIVNQLFKAHKTSNKFLTATGEIDKRVLLEEMVENDYFYEQLKELVAELVDSNEMYIKELAHFYLDHDEYQSRLKDYYYDC
jgi:uridine phosphorylase